MVALTSMALLKVFVTLTLPLFFVYGKKTENIRNKSRTPTTTGAPPGDAVVEKFVETMMTTERCMQQIDTVERKLDHLDQTFHDRANSIMKYLTEMLRMLKSSPVEGLETAMLEIKEAMDRLKQSVATRLDNPSLRVEGDYGDRLTTIDGNIKTIQSGLEVILSTISEVRNRNSYKSSAASGLRTTDLSDSMTIINEFRKLLHDQRPRAFDSACNVGGRVDRSERYPTDCHEIQMQGFNVSGIYKIRPDELQPFYVLCDLTSNGGGWTVFQNRYDGSQDFYKSWTEYKNGFGNLAGEFWLGLEKINYLTNQKLYELRVELETLHGQEAYAGYSVFTLGPEYEGFRISTLGTYYGTAGDSLSYHAGQKFSTKDVDSDEWKDGSCADEHGGAWWYKECDKSNLNGKYSTAGTAEDGKGQSIYWISFKGPNSPLAKTKMMVRPLPATRPIVYNDRKTTDTGRIMPLPKKAHTQESKGAYEMSRAQYKYEDPTHADAFFPSYAR